METLRERIIRHEGRRLHPYKCTSGDITIGYGRNLSTRGISGSEALTLLENDLNSAYGYFYQLPRSVQSQCNYARREIIVEMFFQLGYVGTLKFKKMFAAIEQGDFEEAANEMMRSLWADQTPARAFELSERMRDGH